MYRSLFILVAMCLAGSVADAKKNDPPKEYLEGKVIDLNRQEVTATTGIFGARDERWVYTVETKEGTMEMEEIVSSSSRLRLEPLKANAGDALMIRMTPNRRRVYIQGPHGEKSLSVTKYTPKMASESVLAVR
jgi:hypothetical protein